MPTKKPKYENGPDIDLDKEVVLLSDGSRLTEARAEQLGAELATATPVRGRPSLTGKSRKSPQIAFRVADDILARAQAIAAEEGLTLSDLAREALEQRIAESA